METFKTRLKELKDHFFLQRIKLDQFLDVNYKVKGKIGLEKDLISVFISVYFKLVDLENNNCLVEELEILEDRINKLTKEVNNFIMSNENYLFEGLEDNIDKLIKETDDFLINLENLNPSTHSPLCDNFLWKR